MTDLPQPLLHCGYQAPGPNKFARPESGYTADQMREYGALCRKMALEEAAKFCESQQVNHSPRGGTRMFMPFNPPAKRRPLVDVRLSARLGGDSRSDCYIVVRQ